MILPLLFNKFALKKELKDIGFIIGDYKQGIKWGMISLVVVSFIFFLISYYFNFLDDYVVPIIITKNFTNFVIYEFFLVVPFVCIYEFYFRGFILNIFSARFGYWAILIQSLIYLILVLVDRDGSMIQLIPYVIFAPFAGLIAYKSKSILYSSISQFIIIFILNVIIIKKIS